jgi:hypothetical protein
MSVSNTGITLALSWREVIALVVVLLAIYALREAYDTNNDLFALCFVLLLTIAGLLWFL